VTGLSSDDLGFHEANFVKKRDEIQNRIREL